MQQAVEQSRQAINDCRERRLHGELPSYKASAQCSNPKIFAAWQAAHYPHMDLIVQWLNAREAASDQVDQHQLSPDQFEAQMGTLTVRLTAEEQRRRNGVIGGNDAEMQLQLPPTGQVVGVATPPGQEKLTEKKSAAARQRAAASWQSAAAPPGIGRHCPARLARRRERAWHRRPVRAGEPQQPGGARRDGRCGSRRRQRRALRPSRLAAQRKRGAARLPHARGASTAPRWPIATP